MAVRTQAFPPGVLALLLFVVLTGVALYGVWARYEPQGPGASTPDELQALVESAGARVLEASGRKDNPGMIAATREVMDASNRLLEAEPSDEQRALAIRSKLTGLAILIQTGEPGSVDALRKLTREHFDDPDKEIATLAAGTWLGLEKDLVASQREITEDMAATLAEAAAEYGRQTGTMDFNLLQYGVNLILLSESPQLAADGYRTLAERSREFPVGAEMQRRFQQRFERAAKLAESVGKPIEVEGALLDGSAFDWAAYRDKVVLVYFFSLANPQFIDGLPELQRTYDAFHDRGFEIVGVNVDTERKPVETFVKAESIAWPILFSEDPTATGMDHPLAAKLGILLPNTRILVDRQGNVVGFNAFGRFLERYLEEEYGPIETSADSEEPTAEEGATEGEEAAESGEGAAAEDPGAAAPEVEREADPPADEDAPDGDRATESDADRDQ